MFPEGKWTNFTKKKDLIRIKKSYYLVNVEATELIHKQDTNSHCYVRKQF
jgi:hypothetical protein